MKNIKLGVCIVGCGFMGSKHAESWARLPDAQIVAVVDIRTERAQRLADLYGLGHYYTDYREAVVLPNVDVVSVCTPTFLHAEMAAFAAELGKQVISEKPLALTLEQGDQMIAAARQHDVRLGVGFMRRHSPVVDALREYLAAGNLGHPVMYVASDVREQRPKVEMHDALANGGPVIDMAVHLIDLWANIFASTPISVFAAGMTLAQNRPELARIAKQAPDTAVLTVRYASGDVGVFTVTWGLPLGATPPARPDQVFGPLGLLEAEYDMAHQQVRRFVPGGGWELIAASDEDMYHRQIASFARYLLGEDTFPALGQQGLDALRVARAALHSLETGHPVEF